MCIANCAIKTSPSLKTGHAIDVMYTTSITNEVKQNILTLNLYLKINHYFKVKHLTSHGLRYTLLILT